MPPRRAPRSPRSRLTPPRPPRLPPLNLQPVRASGSVELDDSTPVPYLRWEDFRRRVHFRQGEHITIVGTTGSGKTVLARELLAYRSYVVVLGTKNEDSELYAPFQERGYILTDHFNAEPPGDESRIIFRPRQTTPDKTGRERQRDAFRHALFEIWEVGGWTIYADEIWWLTNPLKLSDTFEEFWTAGRSNHITVVASTQKPVDIPLLAFDQATHLFLFRNTDRYRIRRMAEFAGADSDVVRNLIPRLPRHEFLYVDTRTGTMLRSKVTRGAA